jgi:aminoglycoside 3-N-acetyltransferase
MARISPQDFCRWFGEVVHPADEIVVVYSGIWTFGHQFGLPIDDVPRMLIERMLEAVGPRRTLVLPAYTYAYTASRSYSPKESRPETGVIPRTCLQAFPCMRTRSALNSFLCIGPQAEALAAVRGPTLWGEGSLKWHFENVRARMVTLGLPWKESLGFLHRIEEAGRVPYRYYKTFNGRWREGDSVRPWTETMYVRSARVMPVFDWSKVDQRLRGRGRIMRSAGSIFIESGDAAEIVATGLEIISDDPYALLVNADEVRRWVRCGKQDEIAALRDEEPSALEYHDTCHAVQSAVRGPQ